MLPDITYVTVDETELKHLRAEVERLTKQNINLFDERDWLEAVLDLAPREMAQVAMDYFMTEGTAFHDLDEQQLTREMRQRLKDLADGTHEGLAVRERPEREELDRDKEC